MLLWKCYTQYASKFGKLSSGHRTGKSQSSFQSQSKTMPKNVQTTAQLHSSHMEQSNAENSPSQASTACETLNFQMFKLVLEKAEDWEVKLPTSVGSSKKWETSRKTSSALLTIPKALTVWITKNFGKFLKRWEYQTTWPASWEICMQVRKQQLELDMEQETGSKSGKEYVKTVYCHSAYLTSEDPLFSSIATTLSYTDKCFSLRKPKIPYWVAFPLPCKLVLTLRWYV